MIKYFLLISFFSLIFPLSCLAQNSAVKTGTDASQVRNRLQLLTDSKKADAQFKRITRRLMAIIRRLDNITNRLKKRISKLDLTATNNQKINNQFSKVSQDLADAQEKLTSVEGSWQSFLDNQDIDGYNAIKTELSNLVSQLKTIITDSKSLTTELRKYKLKKVTVTQAASPSGQALP